MIDSRILIAAAGIAAVILAVSAIIAWRNDTHRKMRREAKAAYRLLQETMDPAMRFGIMRRMNAFAFEELVVYALRRKGYRAWHGRRYTGDGGIDGYVRVRGRKCLLQDKRYSRTINPDHVRAFSELCRQKGCHGYFVHTGRTGGKSRESCDTRMVTFISGDRLLDLMDKRSGDFPL